MQNDRELTRDRDLGIAEPVALGELCPPKPSRRTISGRGSAEPRLLQIDNFAAWRHRIWRFGRTNRPRQRRSVYWLTKHHASRSRKPCWIVNRCLEGQRGDRADTRHGHKSADLRVTAHQLHNVAVKIADLLLDGSARLEQRSDRSYQLRTALDQLLGSHGEDIELGTAITRPRFLRRPRTWASKMTGVDVKRTLRAALDTSKFSRKDPIARVKSSARALFLTKDAISHEESGCLRSKT